MSPLTPVLDPKIIYTGPSPRGWHRIGLAGRCLQLYSWNYNNPEGKPDLSKKPPLVKGSLFHLCMAQHYARMRASQQGTNPEEWCEPLEALDLIARFEGNEKYIDVIAHAYEQYRDHSEYSMDPLLWKILHVEELMDITVAGRYWLTGRQDLVVEDTSGLVYVVDHKTTGRLTSRHADYYGISGQLLGYGAMARLRYGARFGGVIVNLVQVGETVKFERVHIERSQLLEQDFEQIVVDIEESIERLEAEGRPYDKWPKALNELVCYHRYGACEFVDKCKRGPNAKKGGSWVVDEDGVPFL